jgi:DNA-directed RNA polymerase specialized sigma24 family protein
MARELYLPGLQYSISFDRLFTAEEVDSFIALYQSRDTTELELHRFFSANPKFLYLLGAYNKVLSEVSFFGKRGSGNEPRKCFRLDFLLQHYENIWDVVELKKPTFGAGSLIVGSSVRPRFAYELQDAIAQVRVYLDELAQDEVRKELESKGIHVQRPKAWIIAGRNDGISVGEKRFLEESLPHSIHILTYDDLAEMSKQRAIIVTRSIQFSLLSNLQKDAPVVDGLSEVPQATPSNEQVTQAITSLSDTDFLRLQNYAKWRVMGLGPHPRGTADDLLQEAILATLEGRRVWRKEISFTDHLFGAMRSIASHWRRNTPEEALESIDLEAPQTVERNLIASERLKQLWELFASDTAALQVFELMGYGYGAGEIQTHLQISFEQLHAVRRRIRRRLTSEME